MRWQLRLLYIALVPLLGLQTAAAETRSKKPASPPAAAPAGAAVAAPAPSAGAQAATPQPAQLRLLIYTSLIAVNQANLTGNYSVLRDLGAPGFRQTNSAAKLSEIFGAIRGRKLDLSPILLLEPKLVQQPARLENGMLRMTGFFPSAPEQVNFDLIFQPIEGKWLLFGVALNTSPAATAQAPVAAPSNTASAATSGAATSPPERLSFGVNAHSPEGTAERARPAAAKTAR